MRPVSQSKGRSPTDLQTPASLLRHSCKLLQVDISGRWCTVCRTKDFGLAFRL